MSDLIRVLPDDVANQIAAGEVIHRPSAAVKELLENAVDSGASNIQLLVKQSGKGLIQVIDDGCGMSEKDAALCCERHATSKISKAKDIFQISTMGFRGEALASIAAISKVVLKTKRETDEVGMEIIMEGSKLLGKEQVACSKGTSISIKNLFYNVPARRNFLKSNSVELRHIIEEFQRVAIAHPEIKFIMNNDKSETFHLFEGSLRQRVVAVFGNKYNQRLAPIEEEASIVNLKGFIGKPEFAKKTRGEQYFFVNGRYIKNGYLHHAVQNAFQDLIPRDTFPSYFVFLEMDPATIDVNIHPTKTEIKFDNDRAIYAILLAAIKQSLGKYNIAPVLDFEREPSFDVPPLPEGKEIIAPSIKIDPNYNPFKGVQDKASHKGNWEDLFPKEEKQNHHIQDPTIGNMIDDDSNSEESESKVVQSDLGLENVNNLSENNIFQLHNLFVISQIKSGLVVIHQQYASERILYEKYLNTNLDNDGLSQQELFSQTIELSTVDFELFKEIKDEINKMGFNIQEFGKNTVIIEGLPSDFKNENPEMLLYNFFEQFKSNVHDLKLDKRENLAKSLAKNSSVKIGDKLHVEEMRNLVDELFACEVPYYSPDGYPTICTLSIEELTQKFVKG